MSKKYEIDTDKESISKLLNDVRDQSIEERNLALDRFKRQDSAIDSDEQFILQGKLLTDLLKVAAERTDSLLNIIKIQVGVVYKDDGTGSNSGGFGMSDDDLKKEVQKQLANHSVENEINKEGPNKK